MQELLFLYLIIIYFFLSCYKGYQQGASYEIVSILFFILATLTSICIYSDMLINKILSIILFLAVYFLGLFISFLIKKKTLYEKIIGVLLGGLKYIIYLIFIDTITLIMNAQIVPYNENILIQDIRPISSYLSQKIESYLWHNEK